MADRNFSETCDRAGQYPPQADRPTASALSSAADGQAAQSAISDEPSSGQPDEAHPASRYVARKASDDPEQTPDTARFDETASKAASTPTQSEYSDASDQPRADESTVKLARAELLAVLKDPLAGPLVLITGVLVLATLTDQMSLVASVIAFALFATGFLWHRRAIERERLAHRHAVAAAEVQATAPTDLGTVATELGWRSLLEALPDPALILDHDGTIAHYNPLLADAFPRVRIGQPITLLTRNSEVLAALEAPPGNEHCQIVQLEDRVPVQRALSALITRIADEHQFSETPRFLIMFRDLTDQQKHAQLRADFISHASHELRTPLASLKSMVETLQGPARNDPSATERFLAMMQSQAARMTRLIDDLLSLSRAEMRVHVAPTGRVELNDLISWVAETLDPLAQSLETEIHVQSLEQPAWIRGDREDLVQVFQNLLVNALKYGREGGRIDIEIAPAGAAGGRPARIAVSMRDDGPGIPSEHIPRLTERFYRVSPTTSREKGGTGLGLAIVKHIVNRHRGELRITSIVGEGSTFTVLLETAAPPQLADTHGSSEK